MKGTLFIAQEGNPGVYEPVGDLVDVGLSGGSVDFDMTSADNLWLLDALLQHTVERVVTTWALPMARRHIQFIRSMHRRTGRHMRCSALNDMRGTYWQNKWALRSGRERGHWRWFKKG